VALFWGPVFELPTYLILVVYVFLLHFLAFLSKGSSETPEKMGERTCRKLFTKKLRKNKLLYKKNQCRLF
jgi:hypothetical protein